MSEDTRKAAERVAERLAERGHAEDAGKLHEALGLEAERAVLWTIREICQTFLSAVEAFDPETMAAVEELRLSVDRSLEAPHAE
ncbi:MAG: hypothetical protein ACREF0_02160 [Acetobacteraceae bacterium]